MKKLWIPFSLYIVVIVGLFLYSYTQVDLSLTLSRASIYQTIEKGFQYIGYFNRPLSTYIYCGLLALLFGFYLFFLAKAKHISAKKIWILIAIVTGILTFSYNAFSYDFFNYIFAAKVVVHYQQNPYILTALDFAHDPMLSFMHWTHNTYQYGPLWLGITIPFYFLGFGYFIVTFFLFKILASLSFLGCVYFFQKIIRKVNPKQEIAATILFALNPLVIIELLVSSHNDSSMMLLALMGTYAILQKKWILGILSLIASYFTKQVTVLLLIPAFFYFLSQRFSKKFLSDELFLDVCTGLMGLGFLYASWKIGVQPWYIVWFLPFAFLIRMPFFLRAGIVGLTLGLLLRYVPFLWQGDWNGMALVVMPVVTTVTPIIFLIAGGVISVTRHYAKK